MKLKPGLCAFYANGPGNGMGLFYSSDPHGAYTALISYVFHASSQSKVVLCNYDWSTAGLSIIAIYVVTRV